jgi:hypothetical protein
VPEQARGPALVWALEPVRAQVPEQGQGQVWVPERVQA